MEQPAVDLADACRQLPIGLCLVDGRMRVVHVNAQLAALDGVPVSAHLNRPLQEVLPDFARQAEPILRSVLQSGEAVAAVEVKWSVETRPDSWRSWLVSCCRLAGADGKPGLLSIAIQDVSAYRRAGQELLEERRFLRELIDSLPGLFYVMSDQGHYHLWNRNHEIVTGYSSAELNGISCVQLLAPRDREKGRRELERSLRDGTCEFECDMMSKDGTVSAVAINGRRVALPDGTRYVIGMGIDISQRVRAERALADRLDFEQLVARISARLINVGQEPEDRILNGVAGLLGAYLGASRCTILESSGRPDDPVLVHTWSDTEAANGATAGAADRLPAMCEYLRNADGGASVLLPLLVNSRRIGAFVIEQRCDAPAWPDDVVERLQFVGEIVASSIARRQAEETLARSERQLRLVADSLPVLTAYADAEERLQFCNVAYASWHGSRVSDLCGRFLREVMREPLYRLLHAQFTGEQSGAERQFSLTERDAAGRLCDLEVVYVPHTSITGRVIGFFLLLRDVTERNAAELAAQRHRDELAHVTRVAMMGELTASLMHELNQPLAAILANAQAAQRLLAGLPPDIGEARRALADIVADDQRAAAVVRNLRQFMRKDPVDSEKLDINQVVTDVIGLMRGDIARRGIAIDARLAGLPYVSGNRVQLQQVVLNLILNGLEAMIGRGPGSLALTVATAMHEGCAALVSVTDAGAGVSDEHLQHVFEAFYTTKAEGLGMGLSISRSIVTAHGGRIWATRNEADGMTFSFTLPLAAGGTA